MNKPVFCATLWLSVLCGCATLPSLSPIRDSESVAVVVAMSPQANGEIKIRNLALGGNTAAGAGSGALIGGLYGLTCGPLAPLCIPLAAGLGAVTGTAAGAAVGVTGALSGDKEAQLRDRLSRWRQSHDVLDELRSNVTGSARKHWAVVSDAPGAVVRIELQDMLLNSTRDEQVGFEMRVLVTVQSTGGQQPSAPNQKLFEYVSALSPLAVWLDERGDFLDTSLGGASRQIANQIVSELALH